MTSYMDGTGEVFEAFQIQSPTVFVTTSGEFCAEQGQWAIYRTANNGFPIIVTDDEFHKLSKTKD